MFTGAQLLDRLRWQLHDTGRGYATPARFYRDETLLRCLNDAIADTAHELIWPQGGPANRIAHVTISPLLKTVAKSDGDTVPDDFWGLECGYTTAGYFPAVDVQTGQFLADLNNVKVCYVMGGVIKGGMDHILYWSLPPLVAKNSVPLTLFSDAFFNTIKLRAARDAVMQEDRDALDRWTYLHTEFQTSVASLR